MFLSLLTQKLSTLKVITFALLDSLTKTAYYVPKLSTSEAVGSAANLVLPETETM